MTRAIGIRPAAELYASRGVAYFQQRRLAEAIADYTRADEMKPDFADGVANQRVLEGIERSAASRRWETV